MLWMDRYTSEREADMPEGQMSDRQTDAPADRKSETDG